MIRMDAAIIGPVSPRREAGAIYPEFGKHLARLRVAAGMKSQGQAVVRSNKRLSGPTLSRYEAGKLSDPDPGVFRIMAELYKVPYGSIINTWVLHRYGVDLVESPPERVIMLPFAFTQENVPALQRVNELIEAAPEKRATVEIMVTAFWAEVDYRSKKDLASGQN